jgi:hypothetical protein
MSCTLTVTLHGFDDRREAELAAERLCSDYAVESYTIADDGESEEGNDTQAEPGCIHRLVYQEGLPAPIVESFPVAHLLDENADFERFAVCVADALLADGSYDDSDRSCGLTCIYTLTDPDALAREYEAFRQTDLCRNL